MDHRSQLEISAVVLVLLLLLRLGNDDKVAPGYAEHLFRQTPFSLPSSFRLFAAAVLVIHLSMRETFVMTLKIKQRNNGRPQTNLPTHLPEAKQTVERERERYRENNVEKTRNNEQPEQTAQKTKLSNY